MAYAHVDSLVKDISVVRLSVAPLWVVRNILNEHQPCVQLPWGVFLRPEAYVPLEVVVQNLARMVPTLVVCRHGHGSRHY